MHSPGNEEYSEIERNNNILRERESLKAKEVPLLQQMLSF
jgi:hypothetical protein